MCGYVEEARKGGDPKDAFWEGKELTD